jgi:hypothetical protein
MEPVSRPEWASPLTVGKHAREFLSALPEKPTKEVLSALKSDPKLVAFLERHPLSRLEFSGRVPRPNWHGSYDPDPRARDLIVNAFRSPESYGMGFYTPDLSTVSEAGRDLAGAMQRTLYHELGHHLVERLPARVLDEIAASMRARQAAPVSILARRNPLEYFCETFSAYRFEGCATRGGQLIPAVLPVVVEESTVAAASERDHSVGAADGPEHA